MVPFAELRRELDHVSDTLTNQLLPHAVHEDETLYNALVNTARRPHRRLAPAAGPCRAEVAGGRVRGRESEAVRATPV